MSRFPNAFEKTVRPLESNIGERGNTALERLHSKGYIVATGLTPFFAEAIGMMGQQEHIREYCPKDSTPARFNTIDSTETWLKKGGGRAMFLLLSQVVDSSNVTGLQLEGYGWTGYELCEELPGYPITSAYRLGANSRGKHLAADFIQSVVSGTHALYAPEDGIGLESWKSNSAAISLYSKVGFEIQPSEKTELRPTLDPSAKNGLVVDTRIFMSYPNRLLSQ